MPDEDDSMTTHPFQHVHAGERIEDTGHQMPRSAVVQPERRPALALEDVG